MYAKARRGEIKEFTGISDPYEAPLNPEITLDTVDHTPEDNARRIMAELAPRVSCAGIRRRTPDPESVYHCRSSLRPALPQGRPLGISTLRGRLSVRSRGHGLTWRSRRRTARTRPPRARRRSLPATGSSRSGRRMRIECAVSFTARPRRETSRRSRPAVGTGRMTISRSRSTRDSMPSAWARMRSAISARRCSTSSGIGAEAVVQLVPHVVETARSSRRPRRGGRSPAAARCRRCSRPGSGR